MLDSFDDVLQSSYDAKHNFIGCCKGIKVCVGF